MTPEERVLRAAFLLPKDQPLPPIAAETLAEYVDARWRRHAFGRLKRELATYHDWNPCGYNNDSVEAASPAAMWMEIEVERGAVDMHGLAHYLMNEIIEEKVG